MERRKFMTLSEVNCENKNLREFLFLEKKPQVIDSDKGLMSSLETPNSKIETLYLNSIEALKMDTTYIL